MLEYCPDQFPVTFRPKPNLNPTSSCEELKPYATVHENLYCILTVEPDSFCPLLKSFYGYSITVKYTENLHIKKFF